MQYVERRQIVRNYKDTLFRRLFGDKGNVGNALSLYNALGGHCEDPAELVFTTIEGVIYLGRKNDVSFIVDGELMLWEHQSTRNPNMPLRGLIYLAQLYSKYLDLYDLSLYSSHRLRLPTPRYYVFYAGSADAPDREELRLSNSFREGAAEACVEVTATVLNVNEGHNAEVLEACEALAGYAHFVALARAGERDGMARPEAVEYALNMCVEEGVLSEFLRQNKAEVVEMFLEEWDEEKYRDLIRREAGEASWAEGRTKGLEEGRKAGLEEGHEAGLAEGHRSGLDEGRRSGLAEGRESFLERAADLVRSGVISLSDASRFFGFSEEDISSHL